MAGRVSWIESDAFSAKGGMNLKRTMCSHVEAMAGGSDTRDGCHHRGCYNFDPHGRTEIQEV